MKSNFKVSSRDYYLAFAKVTGGTCDVDKIPMKDKNCNVIEFESEESAVEFVKKYIRDFKKTPRNWVAFDYITGYLIRKVSTVEMTVEVPKVRAEGKDKPYYL